MAHKSMPLIDSHCHLTMPAYDHDREEVLRRAQEAGITHIITVGTDQEDCRKAVALAEQYPQVFAAVGIHPHDTSAIGDYTFAELRTLCLHKKVVALGEIGLDFYRTLSPQEVQIQHFRAQVRLAREISLPVIIHDRDAHELVLRILREEQAGQVGGVIHCFSGDLTMAKACLDLGFYLSVPGTVTFKKSSGYQEIIRELPLDRLLVETDAPFLTPHPYRGKRNEPAYVHYVAQAVARIKGIEEAEVAAQTSANTRLVFRLP